MRVGIPYVLGTITFYNDLNLIRLGLGFVLFLFWSIIK